MRNKTQPQYVATFARPDKTLFCVAFYAESKALARDHANHLASDVGGSFVRLSGPMTDIPEADLGIVINLNA